MCNTLNRPLLNRKVTLSPNLLFKPWNPSIWHRLAIVHNLKLWTWHNNHNMITHIYTLLYFFSTSKNFIETYWDNETLRSCRENRGDSRLGMIQDQLPGRSDWTILAACTLWDGYDLARLSFTGWFGYGKCVERSGKVVFHGWLLELPSNVELTELIWLAAMHRKTEHLLLNHETVHVATCNQ